MDRKVFIIRTWLLLIALCGVTLLCPSVGIGLWPLLGMMISTYKCCCGFDCLCMTDPGAEIQFVITGFANQGLCSNCGANNTTVIIAQGPLCLWSETIAGGCDGFGLNSLFVFTVTLVSGTWRYTLGYLAESGGFTDLSCAYQHDTGSANEPDCKLISGLTIPYVSGEHALYCDCSGASVTATYLGP